MRRLAAALMAAALVALAWAPHVHHGLRGHGECVACVVRGAEPPPDLPLELGPALAGFVEVVPAPVVPLPAGAPLGAIPGQSPPAAA